MTTSGSDNFSMDGLAVCEAALRKTGKFGIGTTVAPEDLTITKQALNVLIKAWRNKGLWLNQDVVLFLTASQARYSIGTGGDRAVSSKLITETAMRVAGVTSDTILEVDSTSGMTAADQIGIVLDDNTIHWDVISSVTDGDTVVLTTGLASAAAIDNAIYSYTSVITRPTDIFEMRLRNSSDQDIPIALVSRAEYMRTPNKEGTGTPSITYFDPQLGTADLHVWPTVTDERYRLVFTVKRMAYDIDSNTNDLDFPQEWTRAIIWNLADEIKIEFGVDAETSAEIERKAFMFLKEAEIADRSDASVWFEFNV